MSRDPSSIALSNALTEIRKAYPDITHSFIFAKDEEIVCENSELDKKTLNKFLEDFQALKEEANIIGELENLQINAKNGQLTLRKYDDTYLALTTPEGVDKNEVHAITDVIIPTILKTVASLEQKTPQKEQPQLSSPQNELTVDVFTGFFGGDTVQVDLEIIREWTKALGKNGSTAAPAELVEHVRIETFRGDSTVCKVKEISAPNLKARNIIRLPEKICKTLNVNKGEQVIVKPL
ncbi:MAG: hypothetical protein WC325_05225 [Candidatus Bathyarchaeia archaeon]|jgi:hypothetical protein